MNKYTIYNMSESKKNAHLRELGQYFTPRKLINLLFHGFNLVEMCKDIDNITIFDPCMGTGGFLTRIYKLLNIKSENIFGCEATVDIIKFAFSSIYLTTGKTNSTLIKCNSLCHNPLLITKKYSLIVTNPPFGTNMNYLELKKKYEEFFEEDNDVKFEDIYPLKTNKLSCLFTQMCVYTLEKDGICVIVLPDGELFKGNSKWSKTFRKWLCEKVNIQIILKVPGGTFEHSGVSTNVVIFKNNGPTENIKFYSTNKECTFIKTLFDVSIEELKQTHFNLDVERYLKPEDLGYTVPTVKLGEEDQCCVCFGRIRERYLMFSCGHTRTCFDCLEQIRNMGGNCPLCRTEQIPLQRLFI